MARDGDAVVEGSLRARPNGRLPDVLGKRPGL
jgi:hypothetical protein